MSPINRALLSVALLALVGSLLGCSGSTSVHGTVTYEGTPIGEGWVTFLPADGKGQEAGGQITGGKYRVERITPGEKIVQIVAVKEVPFVASSEEMERLSRESPQPGAGRDLVHAADTIPPDAEGNNQRVGVKDGEQQMDFELRRPPS